MALPATLVWEFNASATANMVNGGGFDPNCAGFLSDLAATSATGNSPVISTATYNFVAGDVNAWIYIKSGTNWTPGWYQIASVASNNATVNAAVGQAIQVTNGIIGTNTVAGCATTGSPTGGTGGVDYSQGTAANLAATDLVIGADNTTITSVAQPFGPNHPGNILHITAGTNFTQAWYVINSVTAAVAQLDRACGTAASTAGTGKTGGALSLNSTLDDDFFEAVIGGNCVFFKSSTFTLGESIAIASTSATLVNPVDVIGYNSTRGDNPTGSSRPILAAGALANQFASNYNLKNLIFTGTGSSNITGSLQQFVRNVKFLNSSTTASRNCYNPSSDSMTYNCEFVCQNGNGMTITTNGVKIYGCYFHDSVVGIVLSTSRHAFAFNIFESISSIALNLNTTSIPGLISNNTFYGSEAKIGTAITLANTLPDAIFLNNIIYGLTTGITQTTAQSFSNSGAYNDFFNNTTDVANYTKDSTDLALDPQFVGASQLTGSTATTSGSVLTQSGGDFSTVTDNVDFLRVVSGTGVTTGIYLITSHTSTTLTVNNALGTSSAGDVVWVVPVGHNLGIGTNLKARGFPGAFGLETTGYLDIGAVQREEASSGWFPGE